MGHGLLRRVICRWTWAGLCQTLRSMADRLRSPKDCDRDDHGHNWGMETKADLVAFEKRITKIMATYSEALAAFAAAQNAFNDRQDAAVKALQGDVKNLEDQIVALQNISGQITDSDQAILNSIQSRTGAIADKLDALDALTPPVVPSPTE